MAFDFIGWNSPGRCCRVGSGKQNGAVDLVNYPAKASHAAERDVTDLILGRERSRPFKHEKVIRTVFGKESVALRAHDVNPVWI